MKAREKERKKGPYELECLETASRGFISSFDFRLSMLLFGTEGRP